MSEASVIERTPVPRTRDRLVADLKQIGLHAGVTVLVHSSLSALGWVCGGPVTVVQALMEVVTPAGTLVMPTFSDDYADPADRRDVALPPGWWETIRETLPPFDPRTTPTLAMGRIVETFRTWPDVLRSAHPASSFAAWGQAAAFLTADHRLDYSLGEQSPLARLYALNAWVVLLGVGYANNTAFHLAEYRAPGAQEVVHGAPVVEAGQRVWRPYHEIALDPHDWFPELGRTFEQAGAVTIGQVGSAEARVFPLRAAVDFAVPWLTARRAEAQEGWHLDDGLHPRMVGQRQRPSARFYVGVGARRAGMRTTQDTGNG